MSDRPIVSILMSVYNAAPYLEKAVTSILNQSFSDFEFLIINDGSTDQSLKIIEHYQRIDSRIRLTSRENKGISASYNELLSQAQSDLVAIMDADDIALPERIATQIEFLNQNLDYVCVGSHYQLIDEKNRLILNCFQVPEHNDDIQEQLLAGYGGMHHPCLMMRRSTVEAVGGYEPTMIVGMDIDLCLKLGEVGKLANVAIPLMQYRLHSRSITAQKMAIQHDSVRAACQRAWERRGIQREFKASGEFRPTSSDSRYRFMLQYGWWAFNSGERRTALYYGIQSVIHQPLGQESWRLLVCAAIKPLPTVS